MRSDFKLKAIGIVEEGLHESGDRVREQSRYQITSTIRIFDEYADGLGGIEDYSHLIVLWLMHKESRVKLRIRPWGRLDAPEVGIFSTRFPPRPNPIGLSVVQLLEVLGTRLKVKGLDAWTGSPVLDIKPYDYYDMVKNPRVPEWLLGFWREREGKYEEVAPWLGP